MATITKPVIMVFQRDQRANFKEVRHYNLVKGVHLLSKKVHLSKDRKFSKSRPKYWFRTREGNKWGEFLTGLFQTSNGMIYFGDTMNKKNMLWFRFSDMGERLTVYYFPNFYTRDTSNFLKFIERF